MQSRNLPHLGMPAYLGCGEHKFQSTELRFLVLERYGTDISKIFKEVGRFPAPTVFQLGLQMLDVLDYIHNRSYIHADIKGANILMGIKEGTENQAYLLDFGLAFRLVEDNYRPNPKNAHEGTIEYTSRDRHMGAQTMRGDLEILAYNMLQWVVGKLPWEAHIDHPQKVHKMKVELMDQVRTRVTTDYPHVPDELIQFFEYINTLNMPDKLNYLKCRELFEGYLARVGKTRSSKLEFKINNTLGQVRPINNNDLVNALTLNPNGDASNQTESKEIYSENSLAARLTLLQVGQESDVSNRNGKSSENIVSPKAKKSKNLPRRCTSENQVSHKITSPIQSDPKEHKQKSIKTKKRKFSQLASPERETDANTAEDDNAGEQPDNEEPNHTKKKKSEKNKDKIKKEKSPAENNCEFEELDERKEHSALVKKKKKTKRKSSEPISPSEVTTDTKEHKQKSIKTKKQKFSQLASPERETDANTAEDDNAGEQPDNEEPNHTKKKKSKKNKDKIKKEKSPAENYCEFEEPDEREDHSALVKKKKKTKRKSSEPISPSEMTTDTKEHKQKSVKTKKRKFSQLASPEKETDANTAEDDNAGEQPDNEEPNHTKKKKSIKNKDKIKKEKSPAENNCEFEEPDEREEHSALVKKKKKTKRKSSEPISPSEVTTDTKEHKQKSIKTKKQKFSQLASPERETDANTAEDDNTGEQPDNEEPNHTKKMKSKKNKNKIKKEKSPAENNCEFEEPDEREEHSALVKKKKKTKRKFSEPIAPIETPSKKAKIIFTESESESEFLSDKKKHYKKKKKQDSELGTPEL